MNFSTRKKRVNYLYHCVLNRLGIINAPVLDIAPIDADRAVGRRRCAIFFRDENRILVDEDYTYEVGLRPKALRATLAHELSHFCLNQEGYRCTGHSFVFLAAEAAALDLVGLGAQGFSLGVSALRNWPKRTPARIRNKHVYIADQLFVEIISSSQYALDLPGFVKKLHRLVNERYANPCRDFWHEIISDRGGLSSNFRFIIGGALLIAAFVAKEIAS